MIKQDILYSNLFLLLCILCITPSATGNVIYVSSIATGDGSGSNWANACTSLTAGIAQAVTREYQGKIVDTDEIWVASGRYKEAIEMKDLIPMYGGFSGNEAYREERDWAANETIIDATGLNATAVQAAHHGVLDGFTVTGGSPSGNGGGVFCPKDSSILLANCTISGNMGYDGGGVYGAEGSSILFDHCAISRNVSDYNGGGVYCAGWTSAAFTHSSINDNMCKDQSYHGGEGGGVRCGDYSSAIFIDCAISGNAAGEGGGVYNSPWSDTHLAFSHCEITQNYGNCGGGVLGRNVTMTDCIVADNTQKTDGCWYNAAAGVSCYGESTLTDCTITGNVVLEMGETGGCVLEGGGRMENCTIRGNRGGIGGLSVNVLFGQTTDAVIPLIQNCTINGNTGMTIGGVSGRVFQLVNCKIVGNSVQDGPCSGIWGQRYTLKNCIIAENSGGWSVVSGNAWGINSPIKNFLYNCIVQRNSAISTTVTSDGNPFDLMNCTIVGNTGIGCDLSSRSTVTNCILWNEGAEMVTSCTAPVSYSCIKGGWPGVGNIDADPRFVQLGDGESTDLHLLPDSPCIDTGNPDPAFNDACRPPGLATMRGDMGAYGGPGNCAWPEESGIPVPVKHWILY
ncbi:MAG: right-handed parallel beta-helix repeat-containing protein [bacterium]